jgi:hypothetical protein
MMDRRIHDEPSNVDAEQGAVVVEGPDGVAVTFTPEAADETSDRLVFAAGKARSQQIVGGKRKVD